MDNQKHIYGQEVVNNILKIDVDKIQVYDETKKILNDRDIIFEDDRELLSEFLKKKQSTNKMLQLQFPPEPWIGNIHDPSIIILSGNPGFNFDKRKGNLARLKKLQEQNQLNDFKKIVAGQIVGEKDSNFLVHQVCGDVDDPMIVGETKYWKDKLGNLVKSVAQERAITPKEIASKIAVFEVHPYHSKSYVEINSKELLPSQEYTIQMIQNIVTNNKGIVSVILFRAQKFWMKHLKEDLMNLAEHGMLFSLASMQNNKVTENNLITFDAKRWKLLDALEEYTTEENKLKAHAQLKYNF